MYITANLLMKKRGKTVFPQYIFEFTGNLFTNYPEEPELVLKSRYSQNYLKVLASIYKTLKTAAEKEPIIKKMEFEIVKNEVHVWLRRYKKGIIGIKEAFKVVQLLNEICNFKGNYFIKEYNNGLWATFECSPNYLQSPEMGLVMASSIAKALEAREVYIEKENECKEKLINFLIRNSSKEEAKIIKKIENVLYSNRNYENFILNWI